MNLYFAPLEGITGYIYRNAFHKYFGGVDKYFTPFISPAQNCLIAPKEMRDVNPENNKGINLVPQLLTNNSTHFIETAKLLVDMGYEEVNLNLGCPSGTVVAKRKGSGLLAETERLEKFLEEIYSKAPCSISIKTRIGKLDREEFPELLEMFNRYPVKELIIHPRLQKDFYKNTPDMESFAYAYEHSENTLGYNGDICGINSYDEIISIYPDLTSVMLGRGLIGNPFLGEKYNGELSNQERFLAFHEELLQRYTEFLSGDRNVLFHMKELWFYMERMFPHSEKMIKKIKKASTVADYRLAVNCLPELKI